VLLLSPLVPYAYASAAAGAFMTRYALFGLPAVAVLIAAALHRAGNAQRAAAVAAATVVLAGVWLYVPPKVPSAGSQNAALQSVAAASDRLAPGVPLVLVNPIDVTAVDEQADDALRRRFVYVADPALALQYTGTNGIDLGYLRGERYLNVQITRLSYEALVSGRDRLYLVGKEQSLSWLPQRLRDEGWTLTGVGGTRQAPIVEAARTRGPVATGAAKTG
jgi:hypothetical protein